jgi:hypothetical protein
VTRCSRPRHALRFRSSKHTASPLASVPPPPLGRAPSSSSSCAQLLQCCPACNPSGCSAARSALIWGHDPWRRQRPLRLVPSHQGMAALGRARPAAAASPAKVRAWQPGCGGVCVSCIGRIPCCIVPGRVLQHPSASSHRVSHPGRLLWCMCRQRAPEAGGDAQQQHARPHEAAGHAGQGTHQVAAWGVGFAGTQVCAVPPGPHAGGALLACMGPT